MSRIAVIMLLSMNMLWFVNLMNECRAAPIDDAGDSDYENRSDDYDSNHDSDNINDDGRNDDDSNSDDANHKKSAKKLVNNSPHTSGSTRQELTAEQIKARSQFHPMDPRYKRPECWFDLHLCTPSGGAGIFAAKRCGLSEVWVHGACRPKD
ncbi:uncharacterized protein LOC106635841 isoform X2 [Copidosoma floridanum]|uniref:uncharacterized protein LOC106635841 isoform X2 n=1 Tax=Copidosoma floridanum TaxID=29053 RepID=UPI0006C955BB|nr:uncharacterized protein LOC106635841 isoform X2 [Copidosoma floridanum]